jgi:hemin uptake protein HemP
MSTPTTAQRPAPGLPATPAPAAVAAAVTPPRRIRSEQLFAGDAVEVEIEHQQQVYRLRRTSLGKLILTK